MKKSLRAAESGHHPDDHCSRHDSDITGPAAGTATHTCTVESLRLDLYNSLMTKAESLTEVVVREVVPQVAIMFVLVYKELGFAYTAQVWYLMSNDQFISFAASKALTPLLLYISSDMEVQSTTLYVHLYHAR